MLYLIAKLDRSSRARLSWIQSFAASFGIVPKPIYGHVTLAQWAGEAADFIDACKAALEGQAAFPVDYQAIEYREDVSALVATARKEGALAALSEKLDRLQPEDWTPDTVLLQDPMAGMSWVRTAMSQMFQPFTARVEQLEFVRAIPGGFEVLDAVELKGE